MAAIKVDRGGFRVFVDRETGEIVERWPAGASDTGLVLSVISQQSSTGRLPGGTRIEIFPRDVKVHVPSGRVAVPRTWKRGEIVEFSNRSRGRLLFAAFNALADWRSFLTLTYPSEFSSDGREVKAHLNAFLVSLRRQADELRYLWALEFQERGAPHFHVLASEFIPKDWLSQRWFEIVGSEDDRHLRAGTRIEPCRDREQGGFYMVKVYTAKRFQKVVPETYKEVGRFWGGSRGLVVPETTVELNDSRETVNVFRILRRYVERSLKVKRLQPVVNGEKRSRKVRRKPRLKNFHLGLQSFTAFRAANIARRLLNGR